MVVSNLQSISVGRDHTNDQVISHPSISAHHCKVTFSSGQTFIEDLRSTNGTFVNGQRVAKSVIDENDKILLGLVEVRLVHKQLQLVATHAPGNRENRRKFNSLYLLVPIVASLVVAVVALTQRESQVVSGRVDESASVNRDLFKAPDDLDQVIRLSRASIVGIECGQSTGTGWALGVSGGIYVVSNFHVVEECVSSGDVRIISDFGNSAGSIVATDRNSDLVAISISESLIALQTASVPPIGSWLMVIGNPLGLDRSVNYGSLTNLSEGFIITDAAINPGNSGGPVLNSRGEVVGIASAKLVEEGIDRIGIVIPLSFLCESLFECDDGQWR